MKRRFLLLNLLSLLLLAVACNQKPEIDISKTVGLTEDHFRQLDKISTSSAAYDKEEVKFRLMVEKPPSKEEASAMFKEILNKLEKNSHTSEFWNYYNGHFDIKSYENGVIFEANKTIGEDMKITTK